MPVDLARLLAPATTAVITVECQRGVIGEQALFPALVDAVRDSGLIANGQRVLEAARKAGAPVLHGLAHRRADRGGQTANCLLLALARKAPGEGLLPGSKNAELIAEFGPEPNDYLVPRLHGVSLFHGTELDSLLRNLGVKTVILLGASLNIAIIGSAIEAVNRGYQVVVPRDGTVAIPPEFGVAMLQHSLPMVATISDCTAIASCFASHPDPQV
ncbi:MAG: cysteine hydrolase [Deltaproteobacteria bacterium]